MQITHYPDTDSCWIELLDDEDVVDREGPLDDDIVVGITHERAIVYLDVHGGASERGLPDEEAARRLVDWARRQLDDQSAS